MILVTIDLISAISGQRSTLGKVRISNDGTGPREIGNYDVQLLRKGSDRPWRTGRVTGFRRLSRGPYDLLHLGLVACGIPERVRSATATESPIETAIEELAGVLREALRNHPDPAGAVRRLAEVMKQNVDATTKGRAP
jgi:hypothetical protein